MHLLDIGGPGRNPRTLCQLPKFCVKRYSDAFFKVLD